MTRTIGINDEAVFDRLKARAEKESRSISSMATLLLKRELEE